MRLWPFILSLCLLFPFLPSAGEAGLLASRSKANSSTSHPKKNKKKRLAVPQPDSAGMQRRAETATQRHSNEAGLRQFQMMQQAQQRAYQQQLQYQKEPARP